MSFQQLDTVGSMQVMAAPSLDVPVSIGQDSVDLADTVDYIIQNQPEHDVVCGKFAERKKSPGSLLQLDEVLRILRLPAKHRSVEDVMMLADMMSKYALPANNCAVRAHGCKQQNSPARA
jgi:hypothetical protein